MPSSNDHNYFLREAVKLGALDLENGRGGPFGAIITKNGEIIAGGQNIVTSTHDPTAHAEIVAIRKACEKLQDYRLNDCVIYSSCEPCPMCLGAIYWARLQAVYYASNRDDAVRAGFDDASIYTEMLRNPEKRRIPMNYMPAKEALEVFDKWRKLENKRMY